MQPCTITITSERTQKQIVTQGESQINPETLAIEAQFEAPTQAIETLGFDAKVSLSGPGIKAVPLGIKKLNRVSLGGDNCFEQVKLELFVRR